jgi:hypothetical protein
MIADDLNLSYRGLCACFGDTSAAQIFEDLHPLSPGYQSTFSVPEHASDCDIIRATTEHRRLYRAIQTQPKP